MTKKRKRHTPEQIVKKLRDAEVMLNAGKRLEKVLKMLEVQSAARSDETRDRRCASLTIPPGR